MISLRRLQEFTHWNENFGFEEAAVTNFRDKAAANGYGIWPNNYDRGGQTRCSRSSRAEVAQGRFRDLDCGRWRCPIAEGSHRKPSLIILDLMLSRMPGLEICKILKSNSVPRQISILMLAAKAEKINQVVGLFSLGKSVSHATRLLLCFQDARTNWWANATAQLPSY